MRKSLVRVLLAVLILPLLTVSAFADSGPKPQLIVRVEHAPKALYYLDLVAEGPYKSQSYGSQASPYDGLEWSYSESQRAALDQGLLDALRAAVPEGYHACTAEGTGGAPMWGDLYAEEQDAKGNPLHHFHYMGVPETYQILVVTADGEVFLSQPCTRRVLQSSVTVDFEARSVEVPPVWKGYVLQFLSTFLPTLLVEGALLLAFGFAWRRNWKPFLLINCATQGLLALWFSIQTIQSGTNYWIYLFVLLPAELVILLVEAFLDRKYLTGQSRGRAFLYGVTANLSSTVVGYFLMEPVWRMVVSIS